MNSDQRTTALALMLSCICGTSATAQPIGLTCEEAVRPEVAIGIPAWDDQLLAPVYYQSMWDEGISIGSVADSVGDVIVGADVPCMDCEYQDGHRRIVVDSQKARIFYSNWQRVYDYGHSPSQGVPEEDAIDFLHECLSDLGVDVGEVGGIHTNRIMLEISEGGAADSIEVIESETMVTALRMVNGYDVQGSQIRIIISNEGEVARAKVRWPTFFLETGGALVLRSETDVVDEISSAVCEMLDGEEYLDVRVEQKTAYVQVSPGEDFGFLPGVVVTVWGGDASTPISFSVPLI